MCGQGDHPPYDSYYYVAYDVFKKSGVYDGGGGQVVSAPNEDEARRLITNYALGYPGELPGYSVEIKSIRPYGSIGGVAIHTINQYLDAEGNYCGPKRRPIELHYEVEHRPDPRTEYTWVLVMVTEPGTPGEPRDGRRTMEGFLTRERAINEAAKLNALHRPRVKRMKERYEEALETARRAEVEKLEKEVPKA